MQRASQARRVGSPGPESSVGKLSFTQVTQNAYELCIDLLGAEGTVGFEYRRGDGEPMGFVGPAGSARRSFLRSRANSIEGGTSEIQRNIIGEKGAGAARRTADGQGPSLVRRAALVGPACAPGRWPDAR